MSSESRRSKRLTDFTPVEVFVKNIETNDVLAGPFSGRIVDVCSFGACLLMSQVFIDSFHIFHTTIENRSSYLELQVQKQLDTGEIILMARPIWLNTFQKDDFLERMIGVEFLESGTQPLPTNLIK